jgi:hypothetical protein
MGGVDCFGDPGRVPAPPREGLRAAEPRSVHAPEVLRALLAPLDEPEVERPLVLPPAAPVDLVLKVARHHRLSPLLSAVLGTQAGTGTGTMREILGAFRDDRMATMGRAMVLRRALAEVVAAFAARGIAVAVLKGIAYEELAYGAEGSRPAADVDLLVKPAARAQAFACLGALGYAPAAGAPGYDEADYHEVTWRRGVVGVDLHFALAPLQRCAVDYEALWADIVPLPVAGAPDWARALGPAHAAANQALHMAIHHFDVPALYLVDLARLAPTAALGAAAAAEARAWRCARPWQTAAALVRAFLPAAGKALGAADETDPDPRSRRRWQRIAGAFGGLAPVRRPEQLRRKIAHFDRTRDAVVYLAVQGRRIARERLLALAPRRPSPSDRLGLSR